MRVLEQASLFTRNGGAVHMRPMQKRNADTQVYANEESPPPNTATIGRNGAKPMTYKANAPLP